ncbi:MAG: hypothetical protein P8P87_04475 [Crocinitomicaceae bacterium]|nr:hypothetical protein [Crocinitomicaceae bacterium]
MIKPTLHILLTLIALSTVFFSQACPFDGNETNSGSLTPTAAYQTQGSVSSGNYYSIAVVCGNTCNFNFF